MTLLKRTYGVCSTCYRHIPATMVEEDGTVNIVKTCPDHGTTEHLVENDQEFYHKSQKAWIGDVPLVIFDVTDRCNLSCQHCYHVPDNRSIDKPISKVIEEVRAVGRDDFLIMLGGAEPTLRGDLYELIQELRHVFSRPVGLLSNGLRLSDKTFVKGLLEAGVHPGSILIGLNHRSYHGEKIHDLQLRGVANLNEHGVLPNVGYTLGGYDLLEDVIQEVLNLKLDHVRLRFGVNLGICPAEPLRTLSNNLKALKQACRKLGVPYSEKHRTIYHHLISVNGLPFRVFQWPEAVNIVMDEAYTTNIWARLYGGPTTSFLHQIIMRDAFVNKKLPQLDTPPREFTFGH